MPRRHDANKQMWRDFALLYDYKEGNHVAGVIQWVQRIAEEIDMQWCKQQLYPFNMEIRISLCKMYSGILLW